MTVNFHCQFCKVHRPAEIEPLEGDGMTPFAWGKITCKNCGSTVATISAEMPGRLVFVPDAADEGVDDDDE